MEAQGNRPKRDAAATQERILAAATGLFSQHGYAATGIRDIAEAAAVSLPLLSRYFGSKAGLFEAALRKSLNNAPFLHLPRAEFGMRLAGLITGAAPSDLPIAIAVLAAADPEARLIATRVVEEQVVAPLAEWFGGPHARPKAVAITMLGAGFVTHLHLLPIMNVNSGVCTNDPIVRWFASSCQHIVDSDSDPKIFLGKLP